MSSHMDTHRKEMLERYREEMTADLSAKLGQIRFKLSETQEYGQWTLTCPPDYEMSFNDGSSVPMQALATINTNSSRGLTAMLATSEGSKGVFVTVDPKNITFDSAFPVGTEPRAGEVAKTAAFKFRVNNIEWQQTPKSMTKTAAKELLQALQTLPDYDGRLVLTHVPKSRD